MGVWEYGCNGQGFTSILPYTHTPIQLFHGLLRVLANQCEHLIALLSGCNRHEEALQEYRSSQSDPAAGVDFKFLELLLKAGRGPV